MHVFVLLSHPPRLGKRLAILTKTQPARAGGRTMVLRQSDEILQRGRLLGESALPGERSQFSLFPCDPIEKRSKLVDPGPLGGKTRLNARNGLGEHACQVRFAREVARHPLDLGIVEQSRPVLSPMRGPSHSGLYRTSVSVGT